MAKGVESVKNVGGGLGRRGAVSERAETGGGSQ